MTSNASPQEQGESADVPAPDETAARQPAAGGPAIRQPAGEEPATELLEEPSTEKDAGEEPKAPAKREQPEPDHEAVGIGVIGRPQFDPDDTTPG